MSTTPHASASPLTVSVEAGRFHVARPASANDVIDLVRRKNIQIVDLKFTDLPGLWQHFSITLPEVHPDLFDDGIGFDGSSIRGFQEIHESDMLLKPDPATAFVDPVCETPTLSMICDVVDPILQAAVLARPAPCGEKGREPPDANTGIATTCYFGPELEFFIFDSIRFDQDQHCGYYYVESAEGDWNSGRDEGCVWRRQSRLQAALQGRLLSRCRRTTRCRTSARRSCSALMNAGVQVEVHHHEVSTAGQNEIDMRFAPLMRMADNVMIYKYVVQERRAPARQGRHVHAEAAVRRQRERHALPPEPVERRRRISSTTRTAGR